MFVHRLKLRPPQLLPTWIGRPNVERRLGPGTSVLSVVAGPGYGKTVLAAKIFDGWSGPKGWFSLDEADSDLAVFATHAQALIASLPGVREFDGDAAQLASPKEVGSLFAELLSEIEEPPLLVFDDVHMLHGSASLAALGELLERSSRTNASFVLCGRSMPLSLHAVAARSRLATAGSSDLAFNPEESRAYLQTATAHAGDPAALDRLAARAEGWPAGLALVASTTGLHGATGGSLPLDAHDDQTRRLLFDYLAAEVLDSLTDRERRFLLETSILDILEIETCDEVVGTAEAIEILPSLARRGLFVTRYNENAYTTHQLFREFLRDTLARTRSREDIAVRHRRAAAVLARRGDSAGCLAHLLDADDIDEAAAVLETLAFPMLSSGLLSRVGALLERIGPERVRRSATLTTAQGRLEQARGDWDRSLGSLERAIRLARERDEPDTLAEAVRISAAICMGRGEFAQALSLLNETLSLHAIGEASRITLSLTRGAALLECGNIDEALAVFGEVMPLAVSRGDFAQQGKLLHNTGVAHLRRGDPYAGMVMYERALKVKRGAGQRVSALVTLGNQIVALRAVGDFEEAERLSRDFLDEAYDVGNAPMVAHALDNAAALKLVRGDIDGAQQAYREALQVCDPGDILFLPDILHGLARTALEFGNFDETDELCTKAALMLRTTNRHQEVAAVILTRVGCAIAHEEYERALALAKECVELCARGTDAVLVAGTKLELAAALVGILARFAPALAQDAEQLAAGAAADAIALVHQRDYRFLLRTKTRAFAALAEPLRRWKIGRGLMPDADRPQAEVGLRIEMLGGLRVHLGAEMLPSDAWKRRRARDIFAYLVSLRGRAVTRTRLIDLYWPDTDADAAHDNLRVTISAIRKALGDVVKFENNGYRFVAPPHTMIDAELFDEHIETARQALSRGATDAARHGFLAAAELYRGDFLEGFEDGGWQWRDRERLHAACLEALRWLALDTEGDGSVRRLAIDRMLELAPFDIAAVKLRLGFLIAEARIGDARRDYEEWKVRYRTAVGTDPPDVWTGVESASGPPPFVAGLSQLGVYDAPKRPARTPAARRLS